MKKFFAIAIAACCLLACTPKKSAPVELPAPEVDTVAVDTTVVE